MNKIVFPLKLGMQGSTVADLQDALQLCLDRSVMLANDGGSRQELSAALKPERKRQAYSDVTRKLISIFQKEQHILPSDEVDEATANAFNALLREFITVRGTLVDAFVHPLAQHTISLADYDLEGPEAMGTSVSRPDGTFEFVFRNDDHLRGGDDFSTPDLVFQVFNEAQAERVITSVVVIEDDATDLVVPRLAESDLAPVVLMNVTNDLVLRIAVNSQRRAATEFEQLVAGLRPFMGRTAFADLQEDARHFQISFLSRETAIERAKIVQVREAYRRERDVPGVPAWAFFGLATGDGLDLARLAPLHVDELARFLAPLQPEQDENDLAEVAGHLLGYLKGRAVATRVGMLHETSHAWMAPILGSDEKIGAFLDAYVRHDGDVRAFWETMAADPEYTVAVPALQLNAQLAQVTLNNAGLVAGLRERGIENTRQLVDVVPETWEELAIAHAAGIPDHIAAADDTARAKLYARELQTVVELAFPTAVIQKTIQHPGARAFLETHPDFDFTSTPVDSYLQAQGETAFDGIEDPDEVKAQLRQTQRLYTVTTNAADTQALMELDFTSAHQIARLSLEDFARRVDNKIAADKIPAYYDKAAAVTESTAMIYHHLYDMVSSPGPSSIQSASGDPNVLKALPNWQSLFGPPTLCECAQCRSVYSPAAYFVDLLHILLGQNKGVARQELFRRRPDLKYTKLSCEHTETLIPYIDLVNEVLETYVAQSHVGDVDADKYAKIATNDTSAFSTVDLVANPQHPNSKSAQDAKDAYTLLAGANYPLMLPFDMDLETARGFLAEQKSSRFDVMMAFGDPTSFATHAERLRVSEGEFEVLTLMQLDGVTLAGIDEVNDLWGSPAIPPGQTLGQVLVHVNACLERVGIAYTDLIDLLATHFLNPNYPLNVFLQGLTAADRVAWLAAHPDEDLLAQAVIELGAPVDDACNLAKTELRHLDGQFLSNAELSRFNRFIRFWKKLGCTIPELDGLLTALAATDITPEVIRDLSILWQVQAELRLSLDAIAALAGNIPATGPDALYARLFQNQAILQIDPGFALNIGQTELENSADALAKHMPAILAAFRISEEDLNAIGAYVPLDLAMDTLGLKNLSQLYRYVILARGLGMKVRSLMLWLSLSAAPPWADAAGLFDVVTRLAMLQRYGFDAAGFAYVFRDERVPGYALPPAPEVIAESARMLRAGLLKIRQEHTPKDGIVIADFLKAQLGLLLEPDELSRLIGILDGSNTGNPFTDLLTPHVSDAYKGVLQGYLTAADVANLAATADIPLRLKDYWTHVEHKLLPALRATFVQQHLIAAFKTEAAIVTLVLADPAVLQVCLDVETGIPTTAQAYAAQHVQMHKFTWLVGKLKLTPAELTYFQANPDFGSFDWKTLDFGFWLRLADYAALRNVLPPAEVDLLSVFRTAAAGGDITAAIVAASGWDKANVEHFVTARPAADFRSETALIVLQAQIALSELIGVSITNLEAWATTTVNHDQSQDIKRTLKAKYDESAWIEVSTTVHNRLRVHLRNALVAYLLQKPQIQALKLRDANDLFAYFLIDVEMDACMHTSRLKQAISSVQLFTQRCLLDLEAPAVTPNLVDVEQWKWMRNYRVWEANRKVFLYPENWIEPELRDNKSPFFRELESELLQAEITNEAAEQRLMHYLEKVDEVARLDIFGIYEDAAAQEMHVFGRAFNTPPQYFYRKLDLQTRVWTAWERVPLDIQGTEEGDSAGVHLMPVVFNRRLYLFWAVFAEKSDKDKIASDKEAYKGWKRAYAEWAAKINALRKEKEALANSPEGHLGNTKSEANFGPAPIEPSMETYPWAYYEVRLAWSEYRGNRWTNKRVSQSFLKTNSDIAGVRGTYPLRFAIRIDEALNIALFNQPGQTAIPLGEFRLNCNGKMEAMDDGGDPLQVEIIGPKQIGFYQSFLAAGSTGRAIKWHADASVPFTLATRQSKQTLDVLGASEKEYKTLFPGDSTYAGSESPNFIYQDARRDYYVEYDYSRFSETVVGVKDRFKVAIPEPKPPLNPLPKPGDKFEKGMFESRHRFDAATPQVLDKLFESTQISAATSLRISAQQTWSGSISGLSFKPSDSLTINDIGTYYLQPAASRRKLTFRPFFHAYLCNFMEALNRDGVDGVLTLQNQQRSDAQLSIIGFIGGSLKATVTGNFERVYLPANVQKPYPMEEVDFSSGGAYSLYNWELFFHIPMLIANRLSKNQRFEEAMRWYHFVFDPTTNEKLSSSARYWRVIPFRNTAHETLDALMKQLHNLPGDPKRKELEEAIAAWRKHPFNPHLIARMRLIAYQKNAVMKYLDNLIAWGDNLFRQDTIEAINQATQLYILAAQICGRRPETIPARGTIESLNYVELEAQGLDAFSNALVQLETVFPFFSIPAAPVPGGGAGPLLSTTTPALYFCLPNNEKLMGYWNTIADRLFKIRHCQNIEGVERELALFEPPIDPALLVRAVAGGVDISSVLADLNSPQPHYRFNYMVQKAVEICAQLQSLGSALLSALEKQDAEELALMRSQDDTLLLSLAKTVRKLQVSESQRNREGLEKTRDVTAHRAEYYTGLVQDGLNSGEKEQQTLSAASMLLSLAGQFLETAAGAAVVAPDSWVGGLAGPSGGAITLNHIGGGAKGAAALSATARFFHMYSSMATWAAGAAQTSAGYERRASDWKYQTELAKKEIAQIDKQILAAEIREQIAEKELDNHEQQLDNARQVDEFLRNKYTQQELYGWMVGEISTIYFQCYQLVYDMAKKAEKAYRYELGLPSSDFVQFGVWDSFRKGLLSGDRLYLSLKQMEKSYMDQNRREYEITKHVSLLHLAPLALIQLKESGSCTVELPEMLFDVDYPGHYMRRIKTVSLTIPCVVGPYTGVNCTLTLLRSKTRVSSVDAGTYIKDMETDNPRVATNFSATESIATSSAQNDNGLFEFNFRDERYLPFEGSGAVSLWRVDLPKEFRAFDYDTITDVVLHVHYTARQGGAVLRNAAIKALKSLLRAEVSAPQARLFSLRHEFPSEWSRLQRVADNNGDHRQAFSLNKARFPYMFQGTKVTIKKIQLLGVPATAAAPAMKLALNDPDGQSANLVASTAIGELVHRSADVLFEVKNLGPTSTEADWTVAVKKADIAGSLVALQDLLVLCEYAVTEA